MPKKRTANAILHGRIKDDPEIQRMVAEKRLGAHIAQMIYDARTEAGMTQQELAELIGTKQPVISRLEDADYEGHSLGVLQRIADALGVGLDVRFVDLQATGTEKREMSRT